MVYAMLMERKMDLPSLQRPPWNTKKATQKKCRRKAEEFRLCSFLYSDFFCTSVGMNEANSSFRQHLRKRSETHLPCPYVLLYKSTRVSILLDVFIKDALDGATFVYYLKKKTQ